MIGYNALKRSERSQLAAALDMEGGYVLDFSNRTIEEFFEDEFNIEFYSDANGRNGNSKANRLRTILGDQTGPNAAHILRKLWDYRSTLPMYSEGRDADVEASHNEAFFKIILRLEGGNPAPDLTVLSSDAPSDTLYELIQSIERDIRADKPQAALDRLHLFCVMKFRHLLTARRVESRKNEPLHSLVGKYKKQLEAEGQLSEMSLLFIMYSISVFEKFNDIRNNRSLAHENELLKTDEARFIFDAVSAVLRFIKRIDPVFDR